MNNLILLHGALGSSSQLERFKKAMEDQYNCFTMNFYGHGGVHDQGKPFSIRGFADQLLNFMSEKSIQKADVFGFSMGGYVALYLALHHPGKLGNIVTLGTKLHWDPETAAKETKMLNPEKIEEKVPKFANALKERHHPIDWKIVTQKTADMLRQMGENPPLQDQDFKSITSRVVLLLGDQDEMVTREETKKVNQLLPDSIFEILEDTQHPVEKVEVGKVMDFL